MNDILFAAHTHHLAELRQEADQERLLRSVERAKARGKGARRKFWRAFADVSRRTARPA